MRNMRTDAIVNQWAATRTTPAPLVPLFENQRSPKATGGAFVIHGTLFVRGHHRGHQKCPRQPRGL